MGGVLPACCPQRRGPGPGLRVEGTQHACWGPRGRGRGRGKGGGTQQQQAHSHEPHVCVWSLEGGQHCVWLHGHLWSLEGEQHCAWLHGHV